jgi:hypothetical protein
MTRHGQLPVTRGRSPAAVDQRRGSFDGRRAPAALSSDQYEDPNVDTDDVGTAG